MKRIWLVRHAQSTTNAGGIAQLPSSIQLTELGQSQSVAVSREVARHIEVFGRNPNRLFVSSFLRTQQTALPTQQLFHRVPTEEFGHHELTYLGVSSVLGTTKEERSERVARYWVSSDPQASEGEDSESFNTFMARVQNCSKVIANTPDENWDIWFGHGQFWMALLLNEIRLFDQSSLWMQWFRKIETRSPIPNATIIALQFSFYEELIDRVRMKDYCGEEISVSDRLLEMFHKSAKEYCLALETACVNDDICEIREIVHRLKSTVMIVGGDCFRDLICSAERVTQLYADQKRCLDWHVLSALAPLLHALRCVFQRA